MLEQQKARLATYEVQARFALATMYDRAASESASRAKPPAPLQKGANESSAEPSGDAGDAAPEPSEDQGAAPPGEASPPTPPPAPEPPR